MYLFPSFRTIAVALLLVSAGAAQLVGTYTVNPTWPASPSNFSSLGSAVAQLVLVGVAGPVEIHIYDDAGPYNEANTFTTTSGPFAPQTAVLTMAQWPGASAANRVIWKPAAGEAPIFDATGRAMGIFWGGADYVTVEGIEIRNAPFDGISLYTETSHTQAVDPVINGCRIHDCGGAAVCIYGNSLQPLNTIVMNCFMWRCELTNAGSFSTTGRFGYITTRRSTNTRILHNTIMMDTGVGGSVCAIGAYCSGSAELPFAEVSNNVILKTGAAGKPIFSFNTVAGAANVVPPICDSNCYLDSTASPFAKYGSGATLLSPTLAAWQTAITRDLASIWSDPVLYAPSAGNLRLTSGSPCIALSTIASTVVTVDIDGQVRSAPRDIGADAFSFATLDVLGSACAGTANSTPKLDSHSWPYLGNPSFPIKTSNVPPFAPILLFLSFGISPNPIPLGGGCNVYLEPNSALSLPINPISLAADAFGGATFAIGIPADPALIGVQVCLQDLVPDGGAPMGFTVSNGLFVVLGF